VKTSRFVTEVVAMELRANAAKCAEFDLAYQVWTDKHPLSYGLRHNLINMHRANGADVPIQEVQGLKTLVQERGRVSAGEVSDAGFDRDCVYAAAWRGVIHIDLEVCLGERTALTPRPQRDLVELFFGNRPAADDWWSQLPAA
jgi:hypothetical protein